MLVNSSKIDILKILEICRDIELCCGDLYIYYAELFKSNPEISDLWKKTAMEEEAHANQFMLAIKLCRQGVIENVVIDELKAENTLRNIKIICEGVRKYPPTLADALKSAIKLEEKLADFHTSAVACFADESFKNTFIAMLKADNYHLSKLQAAHEKILKP